ncbi:MAG: hypothetical protein KF861_16255, partial [Planctomycetaceae bacterium]|nr:hypothetical protein [Planctomycetaceae bacterium]
MQKITRYVAALIVIFIGTRSGRCLDRIVIQQDGRALLVANLNERALIQSVLGNAQTIDAAWENAEASLGGVVDAIARHVSLSAEQRATLELAGQGDIHEFLKDVLRLLPP